MSEFFVDFNKVNQESEKMNSGGLYFRQNKIPANAECNMRLLPPLRSLNGLFYLKVISVWANKKNYISPKTFGEPCPLIDFIEEAKNSSDETLLALANSNDLSVNEEYIMPVLLLDCKYENRTLASVKVIGESAKIFKCTWSVIREMNRIITHPQQQNDSPLGMFDPAKGRNIVVSKEVKANNRTSYAVMPWSNPTAMDEKYYNDVPDVVAITKKAIPTDAYLLGVAKNYFLGEALPDESIKFKKTGTTVNPTPQTTTQNVPLPQTNPPVQQPVTTTAPPAGGGGSLLERLRQS